MASGSEVPTSFPIRLEEGSVDVPMEAFDEGSETVRVEAPVSTSSCLSVSPSSPPVRVPQGRRMLQKVIDLKPRCLPSPPALMHRRSG